MTREELYDLHLFLEDYIKYKSDYFQYEHEFDNEGRYITFKIINLIEEPHICMTFVFTVDGLNQLRVLNTVTDINYNDTTDLKVLFNNLLDDLDLYYRIYNRFLVYRSIMRDSHLMIYNPPYKYSFKDSFYKSLDFNLSLKSDFKLKTKEDIRHEFNNKDINISYYIRNVGYWYYTDVTCTLFNKNNRIIKFELVTKDTKQLKSFFNSYNYLQILPYYSYDKISINVDESTIFYDKRTSVGLI